MPDYYSSEFITNIMLHAPGGDAECWDFVQAFCVEKSLDLGQWKPRDEMPFGEEGSNETKTDQVINSVCDCIDEPPHEPMVSLTVRGGIVFVHINETECLWVHPDGVKRNTIRSIVQAVESGTGPAKTCHIHELEG